MKRIYIKPDTGFVKVGNISDLMEDPIVTESRWVVAGTYGTGGGNIIDYEGNLNGDGTGTDDGGYSFAKSFSFDEEWDNIGSEWNN